MVKKFLWRAFRAFFFAALAQAGILFLAKYHQIFVVKGIADMMGAAEVVAGQTPAWIGWTLVGIIGLTSMVIWEVAIHKGWLPGRKFNGATKTKQLAVRRDNTMNWAFNHIVVDSQWALGKKYDGGKTLWAAKNELRDAASEGHLVVWGRRKKLEYHNSQDEFDQHPMEEIPNCHWQQADLDYASILQGNLAGTVLRQDNSGHPGYDDLEVSKSQVLELWPKASSLKRLFDFNKRDRAGA